MQPEVGAVIELQEGFQFLAQGHEKGFNFQYPRFQCEMLNVQ